MKKRVTANPNIRKHWTESICKPEDIRNGWIIWAVLVAIFVVVVSMPGFERTVTPSYAIAAQAWWNSQDPYATRVEFFYLPHSAIAFTPFAYIPFHVSEALWRIVTIVALALGVRSMARVLRDSVGVDSFFILSITTIALAWDGARNGQTNLPLTAVMIWFAISLMRGRYWWAVVWSCVGMLLKPYMIVPVLLAIPLYPSFAWRFLIGVSGFVALPFMFQKPGYVIDTYQSFWRMIVEQTHPPAEGTLFSDIFRTAYVFGLHLSDGVQLLLRAAAAVLTLGFTFVAQKRWGAARSALIIYGSSALYLTMFSPRIENNTYVLIGPLIGWMAVELWRSRSPWNWFGWGTLAVLSVMIGQREISHLIRPEQDAIWMRPLCALALALMSVVMVVRDVRARAPGGS
ncbi:MAG: DUF2029 domain-containing protein [Planctomycetes bacterium]|nr:DUF2029 domain-containing protein [Planctomycetota bacterium]